MPQMNPAQARVIDPILSEVARGYQNNEMIGTELFPFVPVGQRGGKIIVFGKESFRLYATGRAPGTNTRRIQFGYDGTPYSLDQHALEGLVPIENQDEAQAVPGIDLGRGAARGVQDIMALRLEKNQADLARNAALYPASNKVALSGTDKWSDPASKPSEVMGDAIESIRVRTGKRPNKVALGAKVFAALQTNPAIIDRIKYTGRDSVTTDLLAMLWNVGKVVVGDAVYDPDDGTGTMVDVWGGDVVIAYTQIAGVTDRGLPSYGYTYRLRNYPIVEQPYYDRSAKSWIYPVTDEVAPVLAGAEAGFLVQNAV